MSIYVGILLSIVTFYILYKLFHFSLAAIFSKNCFNLQKRVHHRVVKDDFLQCISFTTLKRLMKESEGESKKIKKLGENLPTNKQVTEKDFSTYVELKNAQIDKMDKAIRNCAVRHFGQAKCKGKTDVELFNMMCSEEKKGAHMKSLLSGQLHSYNILHNKNYARLSDLKKSLEC